MVVYYVNEDHQKFNGDESTKRTDNMVQLPPIEMFGDYYRNDVKSPDDHVFSLLTKVVDLMSRYRILINTEGPIDVYTDIRVRDENIEESGLKDAIMSFVQETLELGGEMGYTQADYQRAYGRVWDSNNQMGRYDKNDSDEEIADYDSGNIDVQQ